MQNPKARKAMMNAVIEEVKGKVNGFFKTNRVPERIVAPIVLAVVAMYLEVDELEKCTDENHKRLILQSFKNHKRILDEITA